jgi:DivIVA domain-containing protein
LTVKGKSISAATITPMAIRNFAPPTALAGYDRKTVDAFLQELATRYEQAVRESDSLRQRAQALEASLRDAEAVSSNGDLASEASELAEELASFRRREQSIGAALLVAEEAAARIRAEAEGKVEAIRTAATDDAEAIRTAANDDAEAVRAKAQEEANKLVSEARTFAEQIERDATAKWVAYEEKLEGLKSLHETTREDLATFLLEALQRLRQSDDDAETDQVATEREPRAAKSQRD